MALRMATRIMTRRRNSEFGDKLDSLRSTIRSLLHEVAANTQPVNIDPEKGIDFFMRMLNDSRSN